MRSTLLALACAIALSIGASGATTAAPQDTKAAKPAPAVVNLNTATVAQLDALPGIGQKTAARIIEYRQKNGPFKKIEELMNVRGVGEKNFLKLKPLITIAPAKAAANEQ